MKYMIISLSLLLVLNFNSCQSSGMKEVEGLSSSSELTGIESDDQNNRIEDPSVSEGEESFSSAASEETSTGLEDNSSITSPPPLTDLEIERIILETVPSSFVPVFTDEGRIKIIYEDLDQNGYKDAFFLVVSDREELDTSFSNLSDVSYILNNERDPLDFFLSVYLQLKGGLVSMFRIPVGSSVVLSDFSAIAIDKNRVLPLAINISFPTIKGTDKEWIIFSSYNKFSLFSMTENISSYSYAYDIDDNGVIDIIEWEDGLEEGTGYETYLTWYKWTGKEYREYLTTNIVRNLNAFLDQTRLFLSFNQFEQFFNYSLSDSDYLKFKKNSGDPALWLESIFRPVPGNGSDQNEFLGCNKFRSVVFPQIFENPYSPGLSSPNICNINVRFKCNDGYSFIRTARIQMNPNPFRKPQFSFFLE